MSLLKSYSIGCDFCPNVTHTYEESIVARQKASQMGWKRLEVQGANGPLRTDACPSCATQKKHGTLGEQ